MKELLDPIKSESLKEIFISRIEELILSGKLAIGEKLPSERELALQLGVSRPVVHEGLVDLAFKGLVSMTPRIGTVVNDYRKEGSLALLNSLINYRQGRIDFKLLAGTLGIRRLLEVEIARLAARNRNGDHLQELAKIIKQENAIKQSDIEGMAELDFAFHHQLAMATDNPIHPLLLNTFKPFYTNLTGQFFSNPEVWSVVTAYHQRLLDAITGQKEQAAARLMTRLLDHGEQHLKSILAKE